MSTTRPTSEPGPVLAAKIRFGGNRQLQDTNQGHPTRPRPARALGARRTHDCTLPPRDLEPVATALKETLGVVDHGLFLTHADEVLLGDPDGSVRVLRRSGAKAG